ncbi:hypothetical protein BD779DRAFT_1619102 [Infundibulicybe gibba]|nr:hypothetical protein BD779DRAFT_1619102 [Infundibulicybe gibba]
MSFAAVVHHAVGKHKAGPSDNQLRGGATQSEVIPPQADTEAVHPARVAHFRNPPSTPATRTGPPRSISYSYSLPNSPVASRNNSKQENGHLQINGGDEESGFPFFSQDKDFRGALEQDGFLSAEPSDRKGKKRENKRPEGLVDDGWNLNPMRWFQESPREEKPGFDLDTKTQDEVAGETPRTSPQIPHSAATAVDTPASPTLSSKNVLRRAFSVPQSPPPDNKTGRARWSRLRSLLPKIVQGNNVADTPGPSAVTPQSVNITDELITGGLSTLMLRLWFERDEKGHRRVPVLLHRLRIRISDSLHPMHTSKSVFRIECEYANGAARWVVYRQLRDFISLHTHYTLSNVYNRNADKLPEFPRTSLPYFKFLKKEGKEKGDRVGQADFARLQRESLEDYLINLIRAVMFHPSSNRLSGFLEISALFISLAQTGGAQYKAGFLQIEAEKGGGGFGRKSAGWREKKEARWCVVRESYVAVLEEPGELAIWDVFLIDSDFSIQRPKRYYRQGLNLLHVDPSHEHFPKPHTLSVPPSDIDRVSTMGSIRSKITQIFHFDRMSQRAATIDGAPITSDDEEDGSSSSSASSRPPTPMLDPSTNINPLEAHGSEQEAVGRKEHERNQQQAEEDTRRKAGDVSKHTFYIVNSQMKLKLSAKNERQMLQWITALEKVAASTHYSGGNRFGSFAPIRLNVAAQWLVDGRDYFWNLSRAILLARESIYIHDWWLSPELQMRRPNKDRYRLDRLLERKAKEGVKIYIILYQEVSNKTTPTDSNYAKQRLVSLHPNVMVQRSPSHFQTGTFYWAHHEKMCVIDQAIGFMGGLDLCFGRWDTAQHVLTDDVGDSSEQSEIWPGKDYSNPRISDFHTLNKPEEDMYDRSKVARMPWHDVAMQVVGQPARDLARHFVQRWNYLLRIKNHSRTMPFLLPPPEFKPGELTQMGLTGTCEMQICRSAGPWSMGTPNKVEHSIQNAYLKAIQMSEHFVYIENQFFITSTTVNDVKVANKIGDALVARIIRAHKTQTPWKCCIMVPALPGFTFPVDHSDASAIRIILECQNRTISRGPNSIFARLRKEGIDPDDYISIFSLRNWAKMRGDVLTTEQVYIHAKVCIVDDRLAIIGSANINERSQQGDRDSELAAVIRDTDMIDCTMAGAPFKVGRFAHTLRVRLMREHLGIDVDSLDEEDLMTNDPVKPEYEQHEWDPDTEQTHGQEEGVTHTKKSKTPAGALLRDGVSGLKQVAHAVGETTSHSTSKTLRKAGLVHNPMAQSVGDETLDAERKYYTHLGEEKTGFASAVIPTLEEKLVSEQHPLHSEIKTASIKDGHQLDNPPDNSATMNENLGAPRTQDGTLFGAPANASTSEKTDNEPPHTQSDANDADDEEQAAPAARATIRRHLGSKTWALPTPRPHVDPQGFEDPISDAFWKDVWVASAVHNTEIYRKVFHAIPDDLITTWKQYKEFIAHHERMNKPPKDSTTPETTAPIPSESGEEGAPGHDSIPGNNGHVVFSDDDVRPSKEGHDGTQESAPNASPGTSEKDPKAKKPARGTEPFERWERDEMEKLLGELCGHLVLYSNRFLEGEDIANNFLFNADRMLPLPIYD